MTDSPYTLRPLGDEVPQEAAQLAERLREVFAALNISVRRYTTRTHRNAGAVSRYLNGTRVPPWDFITELFIEVAKDRRVPVNAEVVGHIRKSHRRALQTSNKRLYEVQRLQDQLEDADLRVRQAGIREQVLMEGLAAREQRIAQLESKQLELTSRWENDLQEQESHVSELALLQDSAAQELDSLRVEVALLRGELRQAKEASRQAEDRCQTLEQRLAEAEEATQAGQEAREASELEEAQRSAEEAKSVVDELRQQIESMMTENSSASQRVSRPLAEAQEQKANTANSWRKKMASGNEGAILRDWLRLEARGATVASLETKTAIAKYGSLDQIQAICWSLTEMGKTNIAGELLGSAAIIRGLDFVKELIHSIEEKHASHNAQDLLTRAFWHFAWFGTGTDIAEFLETPKRENWESWALLIEDECAARRDSVPLVNLLTRLGDDERSKMLAKIAESRPAAEIAPLLLVMDNGGHSDYVTTLLARVSEHRENEQASIFEAWELAKS
ncbi:hypothetical protein [Streptomyces sp. RKAG337]|uniref:hypothetical protein n=1 Tax=Streptomyces sp. RKAG337 TaxID=2893404 RepID=UPI0020336426|nr:hypothetical protein [Streptomyces sp. RKAG337]MCM2428812.1 hypothetical protein [Streptomyces sp. RKAG337]